jgi:ferric-dicitrate binding protein FerR (iron transport regulator)
MIALATASSGIAATLLPRGRTAHSTFRIPLNPTEASACLFSLQSNDAELIKKAKLIIWDEAPMTHKHAFEAVDRSLRELMALDHPPPMLENHSVERLLSLVAISAKFFQWLRKAREQIQSRHP